MGNILRHGIEMYNKTMNPSPDKDPAIFLKETRPKLPKYEQKVNEPIKVDEPKVRRVAKFLILIGSEQAAEILAGLEPQQVEEISKEIALLKVIKPEERDEVLAEFHSLFSRPYNFSGSSRGGIEAARRILYAAKGPEKGEELLNRAIPESKENIFGFLEEYSTEQLLMLFKNESAQTAALILGRLPPKLSADILKFSSPGRKAEIIKRLVRQKEVSPEVLEQVSAALKEKVRHIAGGSKDIKIDGMKALADILKQGDYSFGDKLLSEIEEEDPEMGQSLKNKLYTLADVINAADRPIQEKLKTMTEHEIAILIKGRENEFCEKILSNISAGRRKLIREEIELMDDGLQGAVSKRESEAAARNFITWFRFARENGDILLNTDEDVVI
jgi:flagellar motor switch protein FliG